MAWMNPESFTRSSIGMQQLFSTLLLDGDDVPNVENKSESKMLPLRSSLSSPMMTKVSCSTSKKPRRSQLKRKYL